MLLEASALPFAASNQCCRFGSGSGSYSETTKAKWVPNWRNLCVNHISTFLSKVQVCTKNVDFSDRLAGSGIGSRSGMFLPDPDPTWPKHSGSDMGQDPQQCWIDACFIIHVTCKLCWWYWWILWDCQPVVPSAPLSRSWLVPAENISGHFQKCKHVRWHLWSNKVQKVLFFSYFCLADEHGKSFNLKPFTKE